MARRNNKRHESSSDEPQYIVRSRGTLCGWCLDTLHQQCRTELVYYEKLYICSCKCGDTAFAAWHKRLPTKQEFFSGKTSQEPAGASDDQGPSQEAASDETETSQAEVSSPG